MRDEIVKKQKSGRRMAEFDILRVIAQITSALYSCHYGRNFDRSARDRSTAYSKFLVHADIKPENIMIAGQDACG